MIPISLLRTFKITGRTSIKKSLFNLIKGISAFYISADNYITWIFILRKEVLLKKFQKFSINPLFTGLSHTRCLIGEGGRWGELTRPQYIFINSDLSTNCF